MKNPRIITKVVGKILCNVLVLGLLLVSEASSVFFFDTSEASSKLVLSGSNTSCAQSSCQQYK